jgi:SanA protein
MFKWILRILIVMAAVAVSPFVLRGGVALWSAPRTLTAQRAPAEPVAIVFGAQVYPSGQPSPMLADRIAAAAELYHSGKAATLLLSGDGRAPEYDEPQAMKRYAMHLGVPEEAILTDGGGTRTYETCRRARTQFGVRRAILVTQHFHLDRALLLCHGLGITAVGVPADYQRPTGYHPDHLRWSQLREVPATALAAWELLENRLGRIAR